MYFRIAPRRQGTKVYKYLQLVEAYREDGKNRQRVLQSLGNIEQLRESGQLSRLIRSLERAAGRRRGREGLDALETGRVLEYGGVRLAQALWEQFDLTGRLRRLWSGRRFDFDAVAAVAIMVYNRLLAPKSELGIFQWYDRLWWPGFAQAELELHHLYRGLDALWSIKEPLEEELFGRLRHLFNLQVDVVFYDVTSSYFEGEGPDLAAYGYSRDKRPDQRQIVLALACDRHGFPIAHEVLAGNRADVTTVQEAINTLRDRFELRRIIFVGDSGMLCKANLKALSEAGYEYLVGVRRDWVPQLHLRAPADLSEYQPGPHNVRVYITPTEEPDGRYVCCWSEGRAEQERQIRQARIDRAQQALQKIADQVQAGRLKREAKILQRVTGHLKASKATKYFRYQVAEGQFDFRLNEAVVLEDSELDGRYFLLTNTPNLTPEELVDAYFCLQEVERAFREMKDFLRLRPIFHHTDNRVRAHIFVCVLAYLLERTLSHQLRQADLTLSPRKAIECVTRIHAVENTIGKQTLWTASRPTPDAHAVFEAVGAPPLPTILADFDPDSAQGPW